MSEYISQHRHSCALGGLESVTAIDRALPILHSGPGCAQRLFGAISLHNGGQGSGYNGGHTVPCTNVGEADIVFGGENKLKSVIENATKIMDADLFVVLTGCSTEIIGDDVASIAKSFREDGVPIVYAEVGGFNGTNYIGHERVVDAIIDQYLEKSEQVTKGLINIWSVVPGQDPFWVGNLKELEKLVAELGLVPNVIFGPDKGIEAVKKIPQAEFNLLVSPWVGLQNVEYMKEKFGTPYLHYPVFPIGATETSNFLRTVGRFAKIPEEHIEKVVSKNEKQYYYYLERIVELFSERRIVPKHFVTVSDSFYSLGISRFLVNDLGLIPDKQIITDGITPKYQHKLTEEFKKFNDGIQTEVVFTEKGGMIEDEVEKIQFWGRPLILGSTWDKVISKRVRGFHLSVSMPISDRLIINSFYAGYEGALKLLEDICTVISGEKFNK